MASSCYLVLNEFAAHGVKPQSVTVVGIGSSLAQFQNYKNEKGKMKNIKMQKKITFSVVLQPSEFYF